MSHLVNKLSLKNCISYYILHITYNSILLNFGEDSLNVNAGNGGIIGMAQGTVYLICVSKKYQNKTTNEKFFLQASLNQPAKNSFAIQSMQRDISRLNRSYKESADYYKSIEDRLKLATLNDMRKFATLLQRKSHLDLFVSIKYFEVNLYIRLSYSNHEICESKF